MSSDFPGNQTVENGYKQEDGKIPVHFLLFNSLRLTLSQSIFHWVFCIHYCRRRLMRASTTGLLLWWRAANTLLVTKLFFDLSEALRVSSPPPPRMSFGIESLFSIIKLRFFIWDFCGLLIFWQESWFFCQIIAHRWENQRLSTMLCLLKLVYTTTMEVSVICVCFCLCFLLFYFFNFLLIWMLSLLPLLLCCHSDFNTHSVIGQNCSRI